MSTTRRAASELRSARWFAPDDLRSFGHRSRIMQMGYAPEDWAGKPVIAIINTWSDINPCHAHFKQRVEDVKRGVLQAGGFPIELPALSLAENFVKPTTMLYRNMLAMEVEELLRSHPVDGVVLMGGCDKTTPALLMGATSAGLPAIYRAGRADAARQLAGQDARLRLRRLEILGRAPRRQHHRRGLGGDRGRHRAQPRHLHDDGHGQHDDRDRRGARHDAAGRILDSRPPTPTTSACAPASGRRIVEMVWEDLTPARIQTRDAFENAIAVAMAMGCSTNAIIHRDRHGAARRHATSASTTSSAPAATCR